jgi:hypothetical protein
MMIVIAVILIHIAMDVHRNSSERVRNEMISDITELG